MKRARLVGAVIWGAAVVLIALWLWGEKDAHPSPGPPAGNIEQAMKADQPAWIPLASATWRDGGLVVEADADLTPDVRAALDAAAHAAPGELVTMHQEGVPSDITIPDPLFDFLGRPVLVRIGGRAYLFGYSDTSDPGRC
jgi:hypothetical protein